MCLTFTCRTCERTRSRCVFFMSVRDRMKSCYRRVTEHVRGETLGSSALTKKRNQKSCKSKNFGSSLYSPATKTGFSVLSRTSRDYFIYLSFLQSHVCTDEPARDVFELSSVCSRERQREQQREYFSHKDISEQQSRRAPTVHSQSAG